MSKTINYEGQSHTFPDDFSEEDIATALSGQSKPPNPKQEDLSWAGALKSGVKNIPRSAVEFGQSMIQPVIHPVDTAVAFKNLGHGVLQKTGIMSGDDAEKYADAVGHFLKERYGSIDAVKHTLANDPVGLAADISMLFTGGETALARAPGMVGKVGEAAGAIGRTVDPLNAVGGAVKAGTALGKDIAGNYLSHTGARPLTEAFRAGKEGGQGGQVFRENLRGQAELGDIVTEARSAVDTVREEAGKVYRSGMVDIGKDYHMLDFADINAAIRKNENIGKYKGVDLETPKVRETRERMREIVDTWRGFAPAQYHTPEGFDALKRKLGYELSELERGTPARKVAQDIYNATKETISKQAPAYAKIMEGYSEAQELIRELERELVGKPDKWGSDKVGTALRKLQAVMRNNVHTSYGHKEKLAELLVENGATTLMQGLAGQALSASFSRGLGKVVGSVDLAYGIGSALLGHPWVLASTLLTLPFMSPRLLGEAAHAAGWVSPYMPGRATGQTMFQGGRIEQQETPGRKPRRPESRKSGGPVEAGQPYLVGEQGPEIMQPAQSGTVIPTQRPDAQDNPIQPGTQMAGDVVPLPINPTDESTRRYELDKVLRSLTPAQFEEFKRRWPLAPILKGPGYTSDASPDPVHPGAQYAMEDSPDKVAGRNLGGRMRGGEGGAGGGVSITDRIRDAFHELAGKPAMDAVRLNDLRAKLSDIPREQLDSALLAMRKTHGANLMNLDNPRDIAKVGDSALKHGSNTYHVLWLEP